MISHKLLTVTEILDGEFEFDQLTEAFSILDEVLINDDATDKQVAEALFFKGFIVDAYAPSLTEYKEDKSGLIYYIQAMEHNPFCLGTLFNILHSFSEQDMQQSYTKNNTQAFIMAYEILQYELYDTLNADHKEELHSFISKYGNFIASAECL